MEFINFSDITQKLILWIYIYNVIMLQSKTPHLIWFARILICMVTFINLMAAFQFMVLPDVYAPGFELQGESGEAMIRGIGLLFLMWNVPYVIALLHPVKHIVSLIEAVIMQTIGVVGESVSLAMLPGEHPLLHASVMRFILFDGGGLLLLLIALGCGLWIKKKSR